jgi:DNA polymerase-1
MGAPTSTLPAAGDANTLYVIDVSGYIFRAYHALPPLTSERGEPTHAVLGVTTMLQKLVTDYRPALLAVAMDSRKPSFRRELYKDYKATRPAAPPDLIQQMARVHEIIEAMRIATLQCDGVEADDVIATVVGWARKQAMQVVIVSSDKDLMQLIGPDVWMLDGARNITYGPTEVEQKLGVPPSLVRDYLALVGDTSDNIPGVPSVGPKTAVSLLLEHGSLDGILANADKISRAALREKLIANKDNAILSRTLVSLKDDVECGLQLEALKRVAPDNEKLRALFAELGFVRLVTQLAQPVAVPKPKPKPAEPLLERAMAGSDATASHTTPNNTTLVGHSLALPFASEAQVAGPEEVAPEVILDAAALERLSRDLRAAERVAFMSIAEGDHVVSALPVAWAFAFGERVAYVPVGHTGLGRPDQLEVALVLAALKPFFEDARPTKLCVDSKRERIALHAFGSELSGVVFDCMLASYLIDPERHAHGIADIVRFDLQETLSDASKPYLQRTAVPGAISGEEPSRAASVSASILRAALRTEPVLGAALHAVQGESLLRDVELPLAEVLAHIERTGIRVDVHHLQVLGSRITEELAALEARCKQLAGRDFNVAAPRQLEAILFDELKLPVIKRTKTARSTDHEVLEDLAAMHELPGAILEHRMLSKLKGTYIDALPKVVNAKTGRIHTDFRQAVAATGRLSSSDPNLQNIPIRSETGRSIREAFIPREGWLMVAADYSQIELRVLAHLSRDPELLDAFRSNADVHVRTARALFGVDEAGVTREMRGQSKTVNFAVIYGQTQFALARNLRIERGQAQRYIQAFFLQYAGVKAFMERIIDEARTAGEVRTLAGRVRKLPDLLSADRVRRQAAERVARNTPIQGTAADILKLAMIGIERALRKEGLESQMLLTVHDEIVCEAPPSEREALERILRAEMQNVIELEVPLLVEVGWGATWGKAH